MANSALKRFCIGCAVAAAVAVGAAPARAGETTVTVWPDEFRIAVDGFYGVSTQQSPDALTGNGYYYVIVDLPVGATVKFIRINYRKPTSKIFDWCVFLRRKSPSGPFEDLIDFRRPTEKPLPRGNGSLDSTAAHVKGPLTVEKGFRYYIQYEPLEDGSLNSIQIMY